METKRLGGLFDKETKHQAGSVWDKDFIAPTLDTMRGGYREPMILEDAKVVGGLGEKNSNAGTQYYQQDRVYHGDIAMCHPSQIQGGNYNYLVEEDVVRIKQATKEGYIECKVGGGGRLEFPRFSH